MSDKLEKYVKEHRASFDTDVPSAKVWQNIEKTKPIKRQLNNVVSINKRFLWAAAAALVFAISVILYQGSRIKNLKTETTIVSVENNTRQWQMPPELKELDMLYTSQSSTTMQLLKELPDYQSELREELNELDEEFELLKTELGSEHSSEDVLKAMVENYRIKLDLLEITLEHLKRSEKIIENESTVL